MLPCAADQRTEPLEIFLYYLRRASMTIPASSGAPESHEPLRRAPLGPLKAATTARSWKDTAIGTPSAFRALERPSFSRRRDGRERTTFRLPLAAWVSSTTALSPHDTSRPRLGILLTAPTNHWIDFVHAALVI